MTIQRHQEIPQKIYDIPAPRRSVAKSFVTVSGTVSLSAAVDKYVYHPEEEIHIAASVDNKSNRDIKKLKVMIIT